MPTAITFYTNPMSRGQIVRWMLEEVGEPYETVVLGYDGAMQAAGYLAINPMGKVPAIIHDGAVVTECAAICAYLAGAFPAAGLAPQPHERAAFLRWMFFAAGPVEQAVVSRSMGWAADDPARERMLGFGSYDRTVDVLAAHVGQHDYICGDRFTAADVYVGSQVLWGVEFGTLPMRDEFVAYAGRLSTRPAYLRGKEIDNALIAAMPRPA